MCDGGKISPLSNELRTRYNVYVRGESTCYSILSLPANWQTLENVDERDLVADGTGCDKNKVTEGEWFWCLCNIRVVFSVR